MPQANSTTSRPRETSPRASESTLPCSAVISAASSSLRSLTSSRKRKTIWVRLVTEVFAQAGAASFAAAITCAASAASAKATVAVTAPVAGLVTSPWLPQEPAYSCPSTQWGICCSVVLWSVMPAGSRVAAVFGSDDLYPYGLAWLHFVTMLPTLRGILDSAALQAGRPEVLSGADRLSRPVRWVHVT